METAKLMASESRQSEVWLERMRSDIAQLAEQERGPLARAAQDGIFPRDVYSKLGALGYVGSITPASYGGMGGGVREYCLIAEEVGRHGVVSPQISVQGQKWLLDWGTLAQKEKYLEGIATGNIVFSESISEPHIGSSFKGMESTAVRLPNSKWRLNGHKTHVNLGADCDVTILYAMAPEGLTAFLVDMKTDGVSATRSDPIGYRMLPTADVYFSDVEVGGEALLGAPGQGLSTFRSTFNMSRLGNASELIGFGARSLSLAVKYAAQRKVGERLVTDFQGIQWIIADCYERLYAARLARDHAASVLDQGGDGGLKTSLAKKIAIDASEFVSNQVFSLVGGYGLYTNVAFSGIMNDVKILRIAGGSLEILKNYIALKALEELK